MAAARSTHDDSPARSSKTSSKPFTTTAPRLRVVPADTGDAPAGLPEGSVVDDVTDATLIAALTAGDVEALGVLYDRHARIVFALLLRISGERDLAEEILQEVFLRVWQHADTYDATRGTVPGWLHSIAYHLALNEFRRRRRRPQLHQQLESAELESAEQAGSLEVGADPAVDALHAIRNTELAIAIDQLPVAQRAVLLLYAEGFSQSEIAAKLDEPLGTVKSRMRRALCRLRKMLPALGIDAVWWSD
jgi:RNA polymerase sigma-70 factor (ECF subfamily)